MDPYWLFLKTVAHTVVSLLGAAAVLFTSGPAPLEENPSRGSVVRASYSLEGAAAARAEQASATRDSMTLVVDALIGALKDTDAGVRRHAALALGEVGDRRAVSGLIAALSDKDREVRRSAATALGEIGDATAIEPLTRAMKDEDPEVRRRAIIAIAELSDGDAGRSQRPNPNPNPNPNPRPRTRPRGV